MGKAGLRCSGIDLKVALLHKGTLATQVDLVDEIDNKFHLTQNTLG